MINSEISLKQIKAKIEQYNKEKSSQNLGKLYKYLQILKEFAHINETVEVINELIESVIEQHLIEGENKNDDTIFDQFCEYNYLSEFLQISEIFHNEDINIQLIKSFGFLILNLKHETVLYYFFSNNFLNNIISNPNFIYYDDDFLFYYINFLKSLTLKLNSKTIQFFFHENMNNFPLLETSLLLYNHPDAMVRTVVQNIFLTLCKMNYTPFYQYLTSLPCITYFINISLRLKFLLINLYKQSKLENFKNIHENLCDEILYIQDIFSLNIYKINYILANCLLYNFILPVIANSIQSDHFIHVSFQFCIYTLLLLFSYIKDETFINLLYYIFFMKYRTSNLNKYIENNTAIKYFNHEWNMSKRHISFTDYISTHYSKKFIYSILYIKHSEYNEIKDIQKKISTAEENDLLSVTNPNIVENIQDILLNKYISKKDLNDISNYHNTISSITGIDCGLSNNQSNNCVINNILYSLKQDIYNNNELHINQTRQNLITLLNTKDDNVILMINILINYFLENKGLDKVCPLLQIESDIFPVNLLELLEKRNHIYIEKTNKQCNFNDIWHFDKNFFKNYLINHLNKSYQGQLLYYKYNKEIVHTLISIFTPLKPFRTYTIIIIINNLTRLVEKSSQKTILLEDTILLIKKKLKEIFFQIYTIFCNNKTIQEHSYILFESLYSKYKLNILSKINMEPLIKSYELILPYELIEKDRNYNKELKEAIIGNDISFFSQNLITYFALHDFYVEHSNSNLNIFKYQFPLNYEEDLEIGTTYDLAEFTGGIENYKCKIKTYKNESYYNTTNNNYIKAYLIVLGNKVCIGSYTNKELHVLIKDKLLLSECTVDIDRAEPRILHMFCDLSFFEQTRKYNQLEIMFNDAISASRTKENLEENIRNAKNIGKYYVESYFTSLYQKFQVYE